MITLKNISKTYTDYSFWNSLLRRKKPVNAVHALKDVSTTIADGEIVGLIGPNGAGKTTLIKIMTGLLFPTAGDVRIDDFTPSDLKTDFKKSVGLFSVNAPVLDEDLAIRDSLERRLDIYGQPNLQQNDFVHALIDMFGAEEFLNRTPTSLSTGQKQMMELLAILLHDPKYVFLDEPFTGLDITAISRFKDIVNFLTKDGQHTVIITSHNLGHVVDMTRRIILINHGKLLLDDSTQNIVQKGTTDRLITIEVTSAVDPAQLKDNWTYEAPYIKFRATKENINDVLSYCLKNFEIADIKISEPPIEEIFSKYFAKS